MAKKPNIRFAGFEDDWEQRKLGEVCSEIGDGLHSAPKYNDNGEVFFINGNNLVDGHIVIDPLKTRRVSKETFEKNNKHLDNNTLLLSINGTIGNLAYYQGEQVMLGKSIAYLKVNGIDHFFLYTSLQTAEILNSFIISLTGTTIKNLGLEAIKNTIIAVPKLEEQHKIGVYFSALDHLITLHQRKCDELKKVKKFMLQKMFPKKGEKNPEIRFDGFTNDWEQRKVSELCSISTGKSNTQDKSEDGEYPFYVRSPIIERSTKYLYDEEAVITVGDGVGTGKVFHYVNGKYDLHQRCYRMYGFSDELNAHYFYHTFSKLFYKRVMAMTAKTSVDSVRLEMIADMEIPTPTIEEQIKIGTYFDHLDHLITLHQRKSEELKNVKKYMLQNMFAKGE